MKFLSMDMESCSGSNCDCSLCSFGYCLADENFEIIKQEDILVNPKPNKFSLGYRNKKPIVQLAYSEKTFRQAPRFNKVYDKIKGLFDDDNQELMVIGYSILNDIAYLNNACDTYNLDRITYQYIDVQMLYTLAKQKINNVSLGSAIEEYNVDFIEHRSDEDARVTLLLLKNLCNDNDLSFKQLLDKYKIIIGTNDKEGYKRTISKWQVENECANRLSNKKKEILIKNYSATIKINKNSEDNIFKNKSFYLNNKLMHKNYQLARGIIYEISLLGGILNSDPANCDIFIAKESCRDFTLTKFQNCEERETPIQIIYEKELKKLIGVPKEIELDDAEILVKYYTKKNTIRYLVKPKTPKTDKQPIQHIECKCSSNNLGEQLKNKGI